MRRPGTGVLQPCWETGKHVPWRLKQPSCEPWYLGGLWTTWTDKETGEVVESYITLTISAGAHPLMNRMHRLDPKKPPNMQDKRSVKSIALEVVDAWLALPVDQAAPLMRLVPAEAFEGAPAAP